MQKTASLFAITSFYLVTIPGAFFLVFLQGQGLSGLFIGYLVGDSFLAYFYVRIVIKTAW